MKNLRLITFLTLAIFSFIACDSDGSQDHSTTAKAVTTKTADVVSQAANKIEDKVAPAQAAGEEITKEMANKINNSATEMTDKVGITEKVKEVAERTGSKMTETVKDKVEATKEAIKNVEQKQKPSVQDVEVNNPPRPSGKTVSTSSTTTAPPPPSVNTSKPPVIKDPIKTTSTGIDKVKKEIEAKPKDIQANPIHKHSDWNALLSKYVSASGKVNYKGFKSDGAKLDKYLKTLADNPIKDAWSKGEKMAYWINAYNAFTVKLIVDNYPVKSITDLEGGKPWDKKWIKLGGKTYSLNNIENDILRPTYKDARIHFAVNCAAKSCPPILNKAWTSKNLESNFQRQAKAFINNNSYNKVGANEIEISKIFEWYAVDFGDIVTYINKYASSKADKGAKVKYMEYDWALNE